MPRNILGLGKFSLHLLVGATTARRRRHRPTPSPPPDAVAAARRLAVAAARPTDAGAAPPARALPKGCTILNASKAALILIAVGSEEAKQSGSGASDSGFMSRSRIITLRTEQSYDSTRGLSFSALQRVDASTATVR